jgi:hypothetical protein
MVEEKNDYSSSISYADIEENNYDDYENTLEKTAKKVATGIKEALSSGTKAVEKKVIPMQDVIKEGDQNDIEKVVKGAVNKSKEVIHAGTRTAEQKIKEAQDLIDAKQVGVEEQLAAENVSKIENLVKQPDAAGDLASFEGRYPKDLFNKSVFSNDKQTLIGHVTKETDSLIVVFSDSDNSRFDIPKSKITVDGGSVVLIQSDIPLSQYKVERGDPFPEDNKNLRPSAKEIFHTAKEVEVIEKEKQVKGEINIQATTADALIKEGQELANRPRPATVHVSKPESYHDDEETEIVKKVKRAASDLKDIILSAAKIAERKVKEVREAEEERQAEIDAENISKMGELATQFTNSFEDILSEIRTRTYAEQEQIYIGFLKLIDQQRELIVARKDLATRLKASLRQPVVIEKSEDIDKLPKKLKVSELQGGEQQQQKQQQQQSQLPEEIVSQEQPKVAEPLIIADEPTEQTEVIPKSSQSLETSTEILEAEVQSSIVTSDENEKSKKRSKSPKKSKQYKKLSKQEHQIDNNNT